MAAGEIRTNDIGTVFEVTLRESTSIVDISSASVQQIILKGPEGGSKVSTASFKTDGTDGILQIQTTSSTHLDHDGVWRIQSRVTLVTPTGTWRSDIQEFVVHSNL